MLILLIIIFQLSWQTNWWEFAGKFCYHLICKVTKIDLKLPKTPKNAQSWKSLQFSFATLWNKNRSSAIIFFCNFLQSFSQRFYQICRRPRPTHSNVWLITGHKNFKSRPHNAKKRSLRLGNLMDQLSCFFSWRFCCRSVDSHFTARLKPLGHGTQSQLESIVFSIKSNIALVAFVSSNRRRVIFSALTNWYWTIKWHNNVVWLTVRLSKAKWADCALSSFVVHKVSVFKKRNQFGHEFFGFDFGAS